MLHASDLVSYLRYENSILPAASTCFCSYNGKPSLEKLPLVVKSNLANWEGKLTGHGEYDSWCMSSYAGFSLPRFNVDKVFHERDHPVLMLPLV